MRKNTKKMYSIPAMETSLASMSSAVVLGKLNSLSSGVVGVPRPLSDDNISLLGPKKYKFVFCDQLLKYLVPVGVVDQERLELSILNFHNHNLYDLRTGKMKEINQR